MKAIFWYWNFLYFTLYMWFKNAHKLFNYVNPFMYFLKIPIVKKFYAKHGVSDMNKFIDDRVFNNQKTGINSIWAGIQIGGLFIILEYCVFNLVQSLIGEPLIIYIWQSKILTILFVFTLLINAGIFNYVVLFRNNKYLTYFNKVEKMPKKPKKQKRRYSWSCFIIVILILLLAFASFIIVPTHK